MTAQSIKTSYIIPKPQQIDYGTGFLDIKNISKINLVGKANELKKIAELFRQELNNKVSINTIGKAVFGKEKAIILSINSQMNNAESYKIQITSHGILISAGGYNGLFYAYQSFRQIIAFNPNELKDKISLMIIEDKPRFPYRGLHLDVSRHFFPISFVKKYIDQMSAYKYNTFHWHLTDDQGWRIEIKKYPELTQIGAYRNATLIGHHSDIPATYDSTRYGGYYTQDQIREVIQYAADRYIEIIPEIEMPGHASALLAAYPEFACSKKEMNVAADWGIPDGVMCTKDTTLFFIKEILDEVCSLFPGKYIHVGGDEVNKSVWKNCTDCQAVKRRNNLKTEDELQSYFIKDIEKYLRKKGKQLIGWDEILDGGISPYSTVMSWRGTDGGLKAALTKHDVIMTPGSHCYFDHYQSLSNSEPLAIGGYLPLKKVYAYNPIPAGLPKENEIFIKGAQGNVWTEYIADEAKVWYMAYPRAMALSEVNWTEMSNKDYSNFLERMQIHYSKFNQEGIQLSKAFADLSYITHSTHQGVMLKINTPETQGQILSETKVDQNINQEYLKTDSILLDHSQNLKLWYQLQDKSLSKSLQISFTNHLAAGKQITLLEQPSSRYFNGNADVLINGITAPQNKYSGDEWVGFEGKNCIAIIDLLEAKTIHSIDLEFYHAPGSWIYLPESVELFNSSDGINFSPIKKLNTSKPDKAYNAMHIELESNSVSRYVKVLVNNHGEIGKDLPGEGHRAWLFVGELRIN